LLCVDVEEHGMPLANKYHSQITKIIEETIKKEDKIAYIRSLEFLIKAVTKSEKLIGLFKDLLLLALNEYATTDLLTKLNIVEIVPELANHKWTSELLIESNFIPILLTPNEEVSVVR
jgi:hypothetical protein